MGKHSFICPYCKKKYIITTYHLGFSDVSELRCDSCSRTLSLHIYDPHFYKLFDKHHRTYSKKFYAELESVLNKCECGGKFRYNAPYRCKLCNKTIRLADIKKQIVLTGTIEWMLGLIIAGKASTKNIWRVSAKNLSGPR